MASSANVGSSPFLSGSSLVPLPSSDLRKLSISSVHFAFRRCSSRSLQTGATSSTFGNCFRVTRHKSLEGESCSIDGCPPGIPLSESDLQCDIDRLRRLDPRKETNICTIQSGVSEGVTTGGSIVLDGGTYLESQSFWRVASATIAKKILKQYSGIVVCPSGIEVLAYVSQVHDIVLPDGIVDHDALTLDQIESNTVRCPDPEYAAKMIERVDALRVRGELVGGVITCIVRNAPRLLNLLDCDKLGIEAELGKACMSIPAIKCFESGSGFAGISDEHITEESKHGRFNGEIIKMRIAFKATPIVGRKQKWAREPCHAPKVVPVVESMVALALVDQLMALHAQYFLVPIINPKNRQAEFYFRFLDKLIRRENSFEY